MKRNAFIAVFITAHIIFIFLQVHKHTQFVTFTYKQQKLEKKQNTLQQEKQLLTQQLYALKDRDTIKKFARKTLKMRPVRLNQVEILTYHDKQV